jgi:hypothetical protein
MPARLTPGWHELRKKELPPAAAKKKLVTNARARASSTSALHQGRTAWALLEQPKTRVFV